MYVYTYTMIPVSDAISLHQIGPNKVERGHNDDDGTVAGYQDGLNDHSS